MPVAVRFAPSPTGRLHVGNIRPALINWLFARRNGGTFMLRLDDTDLERSRPEYADAILEDLRWLGLDWDRFARESDRMDRYEEAAARLKAMGRLYPCWETAEELDLKRRTQLGRGLPPVYDRAALRLSEAEKAALQASGRPPHWRFRLDHEAVEWDDLVRGPQHFDGVALSDPVLFREDGRPLYTLTSVVDDIDFAITHVIRGEDHVANTAVQIQIFRALGGDVPTFAHMPLLTDAQGQGLSKRLGSLSVASLREEGVEPLALAVLLAKLGTSDAIEPRESLAVLAEEFDLSRISRNPPKFDPEELKRLNARVLHMLPFDAVAGRLHALGLEDADAPFWEAVRGNLERLPDAVDWWHAVHGPMTPVRPDPAFLRTAAVHLPPEPWDVGTWGEWTTAVKAATGAKGRALFLPLRLALTGREHGPDLATLLPLIGRERAEKRLIGSGPLGKTE
ncbi:MAG TPA: glutamate--tRNA ligase [Azospirillaceae bacterium]|nr:glutamate--tRNA ligase [Azospirillaceae bacterium]